MDSLAAPVCVADFDLLEPVLHFSDFVLDLVPHQPLVVRSDQVLHCSVLALALLLRQWQVVREPVAELALPPLGQQALHGLKRDSFLLRLKQ